MITQIEIDGFKTFKDFKVELAPFQVIVGPNGSGKSNLFDALHLLSRLVEDDIATAFQNLRGRDFEQFTNFREGKYTDKIRIAVEMLVDRKVKDGLGQTAELKYTRLRYEVEVTQGIDEYGLDRLFITHESLKSIPQDADNWNKKYGIIANWITETNDGISAYSFISTVKAVKGNNTIRLYPEEYSSDETEKNVTVYRTEAIQRTVLSSATTIRRGSHVFASREELHSLRFLRLNPEVLRQSSSLNSPRLLGPDGSNLPTTLVRMQSEDKMTWTNISLDLANIVPDLTYIELRRDKVQNTYTIWAHYQDGRSFSSRVLSDGTLQLLALVAIKNDPEFHGVLCFEEPENGVHPTYLKEIAHLLRGLTTDFNDNSQSEEPLRQILVTTHSPTFISQSDIIDALLFTYVMTHVEPESSGIPPIRVTHAAPVLLSQSINKSKDNIDKEEVSFTLDQVKELLSHNSLDEALERLAISHTMIEEDK